MSCFIYINKLSIFKIISNGNRTEWSPIRSVIIQVINEYCPIKLSN